MRGFLKALEVQRWDDHRYYHHSRINQSLHFLSALSFLSAYALLFTHPVAAAFVGWFLAMVSRQIGHFFFEPKGFDELNGVTHEYKEEVKVGYNLRRKVVLLSIWALSPLAIYYDPTLLGLLTAPVRRKRVSAARGGSLDRPRRGGPRLSHRSPVLPERRADGARVVHENPHRSVPRHQALPQGAALSSAWRIDRSDASQTGIVIGWNRGQSGAIAGCQ